MKTTPRTARTTEPARTLLANGYHGANTPETRRLCCSYHRRADQRGRMRSELHYHGGHYIIDIIREPHGDWTGFLCDPRGTWSEPVAGPDLAACEREALAVLGACV